MGNPVIHFEIGCRNSENTQKFFSDLFGWSINPSGPAALISTESDEGIAGHISEMGHEPHNYITFYVQVEDIDAHLEDAEKLGGTIMVQRTEIPDGIGHFGWFQGLDENGIGLFAPSERQ